MSFFKAPAWAKAQPVVDDEEDSNTPTDLFSHSKDFMAMEKQRMEYEKRRKQRQKEKEEQRAQRKKEKQVKKERKPSLKRESPGRDETGTPKKRRINSDETAKLLKLAGVNPITIDDDDDDEQEEKLLPVRRSPRHNRTSREDYDLPKTNSSRTQAIDLGGDSDDDVQPAPVRSKPPPSPQPAEEDEDSDPEIAALQREARAKHKLKAQQEKELRSSTPGAANSDGDATAAGPSRTGLPTPPLPDPTISLLITSSIPDTQPLMVKRKLSQRLQEVRKAWCQKQGFSKEFTDKVFLTYCGRRQWDITTCQRLGIELDAEGNIVRADDQDKDGVARVHLEATTPELFEQDKAEKQRKAKTDAGVYESEPEEVPEEQQEEIQPEKQEVKLTVKAKGKQDFRVRVTKSTSIAKIIKTAKKNFGIPSEQEAYLQFDGENLDPEGEVGETEIEDMDAVDLLLG